MKCLNLIILLNLAGSAFGGGTSICGPIQESAAALLQVNQAVINNTIDYVTELITSFPQMGLTYMQYLNCHLINLIYTFVDGISQTTGVEYDYIFYAIVGENQPPYTAPLDCVESDILGYQQFVRNISTFGSNLNSLAVASTIDENTPCEEVQAFFQPFVETAPEIANEFVDMSINAANSYNSIGKQNLYLQYHPNITECGVFYFAIGVAELLNIDTDLVNEFLADPSIIVNTPLSCVESPVLSLSSMVNEAKSQFDAAFTSPSPS